MWLGIHFPLLPLEIFENTVIKKTSGQAAAEPDERPVAVSEDQHIFLCNQGASAFGIEPGLTINTALSLYSHLEVKERDKEKEVAILNNLAELAYQFSSHVVPYTNQHQQHSLLMEIAGSVRLFNGVDSLLSQISKTVVLKELKFPHQEQEQEQEHRHFKTASPLKKFAIAKNLKAAELLARCSLKKDAGKQDNKKNLQLIDADIDNAAISLLDCPPKTVSQCQDMGLERLGDLLDLPTAALGKRFDKNFILYLKELRGSKISPFNHFIPADSFKHELFYIDGLRSHDDLLHPIQKLLQDLCAHLQKRQIKCLAMDWHFTRFSKQKNQLQLQFSQAQSDYKNLLLLTRLQLDQIPLDSPVESVELHARQFCPVDIQARDLFNTYNQRGNPFLLADKITGKLGQQALQEVQLFSHHLPEQKNKALFSNLRGQNPLIKQRALKGSDPLFKTLPKPAWLLETPEQLFKKDEAIYQGRQALQIINGPERIEGNWWQKKTSRDYFIATPKNSNENIGHSAFYWIYHDRLDKKWYLHGVFA